MGKYKRVSYGTYKSEKITTLEHLECEMDKAFSEHVYDVSIVHFTKQTNGAYAGIETCYTFKDGQWIEIL